MIKESVFEEHLLNGDLEITGRLVDASNATLFGEVIFKDQILTVVYKPIAGERPLWDFESGQLAWREIAAYKVSQICDFNLVPTTILRDGPFGPGAVQRWIDVDPNFDVVSWGQTTDRKLRRMALFDAVINNTDRKFGHILFDQQGYLYGCDHGVTFHEDFKLRTVIWQFAGELFLEEEIQLLNNLRTQEEKLTLELEPLLTRKEISAFQARIEYLLKTGRFPLPNPEWPAVPWPPV